MPKRPSPSQLLESALLAMQAEKQRVLARYQHRIEGLRRAIHHAERAAEETTHSTPAGGPKKRPKKTGRKARGAH